ncbi:transporter substrate-binding domain-containing protein [Terasakiella sp. A23]|uniref:substrate-binding periplasmic protein n=1 Tax=Terasakiella sp. FCG-A23 TaxID=3080561 RepID=UPI0029536992|nr:transporter substrate-binding domain-containing protein [Terasakiella sp. A23]MDV7338951.1 transporter substrate-binding domain-containing protein [Terasakiella sp. A23]
MNKALVAVFVFLLSLQIATATAQSLKVGVGLSKPPYIIQENNSGVEYEIMSRALEIAGYRMVPKYMPLLRIPHELNGGGLDAGMHLRAHISIDGFFSDEVISYRNYAIALEAEDLKLESLSDLKKVSVIAFQNAKKLLGEHFFEAVDGNKNYAEIANQELQVRMLAAGRAQVAVADHRIFLHFKKVFETKNGKFLRFRFYPLFDPTPYRAAFRSRAVRDAFDEGLAELKRSGEYDRIISKYIAPDELIAVTQ